MSCLSNKDLSYFCSLVKAKKGKTVEQTCRNIVSKIDTRMSCIRKKELQHLAKSLGLKDKGTMKEILNNIQRKLETDTEEKKEIPQKIQDEIVKKYNYSVKHLEKKVYDCFIYFNQQPRNIVIVKVPEQYFTEKGTWIPEGRYYRPNTCKNLAYYLSSGTSNEGKNFPNMWFPFLRVKTSEKGNEPKGWLDKAYGLETSIMLFKHLKKSFNIDVMSKTPEMMFLLVFLEKFSYWWQITISASLPSPDDTKWNEPILRKIRDLALTYEYDTWSGFKKNKNIIQKYLIPSCNDRLTVPEDVNTRLKMYRALCYDKD